MGLLNDPAWESFGWEGWVGRVGGEPTNYLYPAHSVAGSTRKYKLFAPVLYLAILFKKIYKRSLLLTTLGAFNWLLLNIKETQMGII